MSPEQLQPNEAVVQPNQSDNHAGLSATPTKIGSCSKHRELRLVPMGCCKMISTVQPFHGASHNYEHQELPGCEALFAVVHND